MHTELMPWGRWRRGTGTHPEEGQELGSGKGSSDTRGTRGAHGSDMQGKQHTHRGRASERAGRGAGKAESHLHTMETSGWKKRCSEGHGLRHAGGLQVAKGPCVAQDKGDD